VPVFSEEEGVAYIEPATCQGCGICAGVCPNKAIQVQHYKDRQVISKCDVLYEVSKT
jgi:heterodisulfide reductase subunit A-like polyferredoxin